VLSSRGKVDQRFQELVLARIFDVGTRKYIRNKQGCCITRCRLISGDCPTLPQCRKDGLVICGCFGMVLNDDDDEIRRTSILYMSQICFKITLRNLRCSMKIYLLNRH